MRVVIGRKQISKSAWQVFLLPLLLSHCATQHQPKAFQPFYFSSPSSTSLGRAWPEMQTLQSKPNRTPLETRRLLELYSVESRTLKPRADRAVALQAELDLLRPTMKSFDDEIAAIRAETRKLPAIQDTKPEPVPTGYRKEYSEIQKMWNRDETDAALRQWEAIMTAHAERMNSAEKHRFQGLKFRILLELGEFPGAEKAYRNMEDLLDCHSDTTQAGFLTALTYFNRNESAKALEVFDEQCDQDETASNLIRRQYWRARFMETTNRAKAMEIYRELAKSALPGYHGFLAQARLGEPMHILRIGDAEERSYLKQEISVSKKIHTLWTKAEERIAHGLRRDAAVYLGLASRLLRESPGEDEIPAILYTAHLLHAAGDHLEAFKLYASASQQAFEDDTNPPWATVSFVKDMFPRPFEARVEWLSRMWDVDPDFVFAIMRQESGFNPGAVSTADARGLMQLMPSLARTLTKQWSYRKSYTDGHLFKAEENMKLGVFHLTQLRQLVPHYTLIAASYNAGLSRALKWWRRYGMYPLDVFVEFVPITETRNYMKLVTRNYVYYKAIRTSGPLEPDVVPFDIGPLPETLRQEGTLSSVAP